MRQFVMIFSLFILLTGLSLAKRVNLDETKTETRQTPKRAGSKEIFVMLLLCSMSNCNDHVLEYNLI